MRRLRTACAVLAMATGAGGLAQTAAFADGSAISIQWAQTAADNNGKISVALSATSPITTISAALYSYATQQTVATVSNFALTSGTTEDGQWETTARVQLPALGGYRIDLTVTDSAGDTTTEVEAGNFYYQVQTFFKNMAVDRHTVDISDQQVTISGQLMGRWPSSGAVTALAGLPVYISNDWVEDNMPTTDANGDFSSVETVTATGSLQAIYAYDNDYVNYGQSGSAQIPITAKLSDTKIVENLSAAKVQYDGEVSLSATLLWDSPTGWLPLAGKQVGATGCGYQSVQTITDANGNITLPPGGQLVRDCTVLVGWSSDNPFMKDAQSTKDVSVVQPADFSDFSGTRTDAQDVILQGHMQFPGMETPGSIVVDIQFSATGKGSWSTVATADAYWDGTGYGFAPTVSSTTAGYWRAAYSGAPIFTDATSSVAYVAGPSS
ncbi:MAG TPA: hypothetical protein VGX23_37405 [Actinocrinis sp.]|nr:hypothetical protein [Actinocrinis sp.]